MQSGGQAKELHSQSKRQTPGTCLTWSATGASERATTHQADTTAQAKSARAQGDMHAINFN
jgi:hypothetical protein